MQAFMQVLGLSGLSIDVTPNGTVTVFPILAKPAMKAVTAARASPAAYEVASHRRHAALHAGAGARSRIGRGPKTLA
jgi:hypothetical protein